ncbi:ribonuclease J [Candidatus Bealeia paramacronuclearis]
MKFDKNALYFLPLGGCGEIGMNLNLYHDQGKWIMVDMGITFDDTPGIEVVMPDITFLEEIKDDLLGLVLTHAHEDHYGAIQYLWTKIKCPIFATPFTAEMLKYKTKEAGINPPVHVIPLGGGIDIGPFSIDFINLTHSIPEPNALAIKTTKGTILHTGDWKIDPNPLVGDSTDEDKLKRLGKEGVLALVCDSTNVFEEGRSGSEAVIRENLIELAGKYPGKRVVMACFASNVARVATGYEAAHQNGRFPVLVRRSLEKVDAAARASGYFQGMLPFLKAYDAKALDRGKTLLICTGSQGEQRAALKRIASQEDRHIKLETGDVVIFSSRQIPGNEKQIDELQNMLVEQGVELITHIEADVHVSGHPCRDELIDMYGWTKPQILIPVHGEEKHLVEQSKLGKLCQIPHTIVTHNGQVVELTSGKPEIVGEVHHGRLAVDGNVLIPFQGETMHIRHRMMANGQIIATLVVSEKGQLLAEPEILFFGVGEFHEELELQEDCIESLQAILADMTLDELQDDVLLEEKTRTLIRRIVNAARGKKPPTHVQVIRV